MGLLVNADEGDSEEARAPTRPCGAVVVLHSLTYEKRGPSSA